MRRSSFLVNLQACRLIAGNFTIKWTPSQVFFNRILSLPPCIDLKPSPSNFEEPLLPCSQNLWETLGLLWRGEGVLKEQIKINRGRGEVKPISMLTLWKIAWFFKQQIEFLLISCLAVAKSFMKKVNTFF